MYIGGYLAVRNCYYLIPLIKPFQKQVRVLKCVIAQSTYNKYAKQVFQYIMYTNVYFSY
jgi:hypothetical protein